MLRCVSMTPLGSPVLPLEKITVARSSRLVSVPAEEPAVDHERRQQQDGSDGRQALDGGDGLAEVFEIDQFDAGTGSRAILAKEPGSQDVPDAALCGSRNARSVRRQRVIQVGRGLAEEGQGDVGERPADARRQPDTDDLLSPRRGRSLRVRIMAPARASQ